MVKPQEKDDMIRITVVNGHQLVLAGASGLLKDAAGIKVIADAGSGEKAVDLVSDLKPDVALMDIQMPRMGGFKGSRSQEP
jgi:two-component system invasion response regulator UvrY